jgi:hypothetical protein
MELLAWLEQTEFSTWLRESDWGYPIVLCAHAIGMGIVVGVSIMFCARVLGYAKEFALQAFDRLFGIAWFGFALNAVSGTLLFIGEPRRLLVTPAFLIKMGLIMLAGLALWVLSKTLEDAEPMAGPATLVSAESVISPAAKVAAIFPILLWLGAIVAGRLIGYTIGPPPV